MNLDMKMGIMAVMAVMLTAITTVMRIYFTRLCKQMQAQTHAHTHMFAQDLQTAART